jgi:DNA-binding PadR family transcriptional regulator
MYTLLRRMEHRGVLESEWIRSENTRPERRIYKVTEKGKQELRTGLESITRQKTMLDDLADFYRRQFVEHEVGGE